MAMWNMLGARDVDICHWESFGKGWFADAISHLNLRETVTVNEHTADYGQLPDLSKCNPKNDICFTFNGTTSGVRVPDGCDFISDDREGLTLCDATSACFAMNMPWEKLDVTTYSWQKYLEERVLMVFLFFHLVLQNVLKHTHQKIAHFQRFSVLQRRESLKQEFSREQLLTLHP